MIGDRKRESLVDAAGEPVTHIARIRSLALARGLLEGLEIVGRLLTAFESGEDQAPETRELDAWRDKMRARFDLP